ncbi:MAG: hypothetical protein AB7F86_16245 [Bdellovibrionales bacterium]
MLKILMLLISTSAQAQLDTTSVLLRSGGKSQQSQNLDSSKYRIRTPESRKDDDIEEREGTYIASPVTPRQGGKTTIKSPVKKVNPEATPETAPIIPKETVPAAANPEATPPPPVTVQVKEMILGGSDDDIEDYRKSLHPEDPRANVISVSLAPAYYYNGSDSNYSFRRFHSAGPGLGLGMNVWITPFFGLQSKFFSSVSASQRSGGVNFVPVDLQNFEAGLRFRKHFGYSRKSKQLSLGLDYHDSITKISTDATTAIGRKSSGLSLVLEAQIPTSNTYAQTIQLDIRPRLKHSESNTGVEAKSGTKNETNALGFAYGGQWIMDRNNQVFWKAQYLVERNLFDGQATTQDPHNDQTPTGVNVTDSKIIFYFGFQWGS